MRWLQPAPQIRRANALLAVSQLDYARKQLVEQLTLALRGELDTQLPQMMSQ